MQTKTSAGGEKFISFCRVKQTRRTSAGFSQILDFRPLLLWIQLQCGHMCI